MDLHGRLLSVNLPIFAVLPDLIRQRSVVQVHLGSPSRTSLPPAQTALVRHVDTSAPTGRGGRRDSRPVRPPQLDHLSGRRIGTTEQRVQAVDRLVRAVLNSRAASSPGPDPLTACVDSNLAGAINATTPLWTVLFALLARRPLLILSPWKANSAPLPGVLACIGASASYVYMGRYFTNRGPSSSPPANSSPPPACSSWRPRSAGRTDLAIRRDYRACRARGRRNRDRPT